MTVLGFEPWSPTPASKRLIGQVLEVLDENADYLPMTGRQIFYRLVGAHGYGKTEKKYKALLAKLARARRAGLVDFDAIRDDGVTTRGGGGYSSPESWLESFRHYAESYRRQRQDGQRSYLEVWVEAAGMVPQAARVANEYGVPVYSSGGFNSVTMKHDAAKRFARRYRFSKGRTTTVLHIGDMDPSGESIFENLSRDIPAFLEGLDGSWGSSTWERVAVVDAQVDAYDLETAPPKASDSRSATWSGETVQVEAMSPQQLAGEIEDAIGRHFDMGKYREVLAAEKAERADLLSRLDDLLPG